MDGSATPAEAQDRALPPVVEPSALRWLELDHERERAALRAMLDYSPVGVALFDVEHRAVVVNPAMARFARRDVAELLHRRPGEVTPWMGAAVEPCLQQVIETGQPVPDVEVSRPARPGGGEQHWTVSCFPVRDRWGNLIGTAAAAMDVTDRVAAERRLRRINSAMQASLVPSRLPEIPGLDLAGRHLGAEHDVELGGDFYKVLPLNRRRWLMAIGDVCGRGLEATSITSLARHTLRDTAILSPDPREVLTSLHDALCEAGADRFVTVAASVWRPLRAGFEVQLALGGHPPALVACPGEPVGLLGEPGTLLGTDLRPELTTTVRRLEPGATVVLYTDGLTDSTRPCLDESDLLAALDEVREAPAEVVADALLDAGRGRPRVGHDDTALLVARVASR